uniref:Uncharacterized protein n=1 Tax=Panagrolaimus sp. ES5 TaxID=591445 RepID=A0AC34F7M0_9BILA
MISALFKWEFVAEKNILFVFAEHDFQDFALIFDDSKLIKKVFDNLLKNGAIHGNEELIKQRFLPLLFNQISQNIETNLKIKEIFVDWIQKLDVEKKKEFIQILEAKNVYDLIYPNEDEEVDNRRLRRKRKAKDISYRDESDGDNVCSDYNNPKFVTERLIKRPSCKTPKLQNESFKSNIVVEDQCFEVFNYVKRNITRKKLLIFSSAEQKYCYEYFWNKTKKCFICAGCFVKRNQSITETTTTAKFFKSNGKNRVQLSESEHVCELQEYIEKPNFEIFSCDSRQKNIKRLIIFLDSSRTKCYEYSWRKCSYNYACCGCMALITLTTAKICQKEDGTEYILLKSNKHVCKIRQFYPQKYAKPEIVEAGKFKELKNIRNDFNNSILIIFASVDKSTYYKYSWNDVNKKYYCCSCNIKKAFKSAEICQDSDGRQFVKLGWQKHVCSPRKYDPKKYEKEIVESSNYKIYEYKHKGKMISKLIVFSPSNKTFCYEFYWHKTKKVYQCCCCPMTDNVNAVVCYDEQKKEFLILSKSQNNCELHEFDGEKYEDDAIIKKPMYAIFLMASKNVKFLVILKTEKQDACYKFLYNDRRKCYQCSKCSSSKSHFLPSAIIQNEGKENECVFLSNQKHFCEPLNYLEVINDANRQIVMSPNFQIIKRKSNRRNVQHLCIFTNDDKSECFRYTWLERKKYFICNPCNDRFKTFVFAKLFKNSQNQECIELGPEKHKCEPIKFDPDKKPLKIIKEPDFKLYETFYHKTKVQRLIIFDSNDKELGYTYSYCAKQKGYICIKCRTKKNFVTAQVLQDENGLNYVELCRNEHVCEPEVPEDVECNFVKLPNFKLWEEFVQKKLVQRLTIFNSNDKNFGHIYSYQPSTKRYLCLPCKYRKKNVFAYLLQDENGQNYVKLSNVEHVCVVKKL